MPEIARLQTVAQMQALLGIIALGSAYGFQYLGGLQPCALCLYQRWPWWAAIALGAAALFLRGRAMGLVLGLLASAVVLGGAGIAAFHVGVEQHWWPGLASCGGVSDAPMTLEALKRQIMSAPVVRCDEIPWSLFGISMAGYNALLSFAAGLGGVFLTWKYRDAGTRNAGTRNAGP